MYMIINTLRKWFLFTPAPQRFTEKLRRFQLFPGFAWIFQVFPGRNYPDHLQK